VTIPYLQAAGGASSDGKGSILDCPITSTEMKSIICLGAKDLVEQVRKGSSCYISVPAFANACCLAQHCMPN